MEAKVDRTVDNQGKVLFTATVTLTCVGCGQKLITDGNRMPGMTQDGRGAVIPMLPPDGPIPWGAGQNPSAVQGTTTSVPPKLRFKREEKN